ncbi:MAG: Fic family protein [Clostridiales bacterium]|nr:Fic family protein [Clostridiales bacterium]
MCYQPPFDVTNKMLELAASIMEKIGRLNGVNQLEKIPRLRKVSRIKSIYSSLAIENNLLNIDQVTDVLDGKRVVGAADDILAVKNASRAYEKLEEVDPFSVDDLLSTHGVMMEGLTINAGYFRSSGVGVFDSSGKLIHAAPPANMLNELVYRLFDWCKSSDIHMLIRSSVFHYEFEFIHPFTDGNGRMGRLWQTALLANWKPIFKWIPIESIIKENQERYYQAISRSTAEGKSNAFVEFMLEVIDVAINGILTDAQAHYSHISVQISRLMEVIETYPQTAKQLMEKLGLKNRDGFRNNYLIPAIEAGLIGMTIPDKPTSKNQMYYKK